MVTSRAYPLIGDGTQLDFTLIRTVPEPTTAALTALGLLSLGFIGWRRRRR